MLDQYVHVLIRYKTGVNLVSIRFVTVVQFTFEQFKPNSGGFREIRGLYLPFATSE